MKTFIELAKNRYSCRAYLNKPVEEEKLNLILEAGRIAPSAVNYQPWQFIIIRSEKYLEGIRQCYHREWFKTAPVAIVICGNHDLSWKRKSDNKDHTDVDTAIAIDHMTLMASDLDLATCWICNFDVEKTRQLLELPDNLEPIAILPIGYPADKCNPDRHQEKRKSLDEVIRFI